MNMLFARLLRTAGLLTLLLAGPAWGQEPAAPGTPAPAATPPPHAGTCAELHAQALRWSQQAAADGAGAVAEPLAAELSKDDANPFASYLWVFLYGGEASGKLPPKARDALAELPVVYGHWKAERYAAALNAFAVGDGARIRNPWSLTVLADCARKLGRTREELGYREAYLQQHPTWLGFDAWWPLYELARRDTTLQAEVLAQFETDPRLVAWRDPVATLCKLDHADPWTEFSVAARWLQQENDDAGAVRWCATFMLANQYPRDADEMLHPVRERFYQPGAEETRRLALQSAVQESRLADAQAEVAAWTKFAGAADAREAWIGALLDGGEQGAAREQLAALGQQGLLADDAVLQRDLAELELRSHRPEQAAAAARRQVELVPGRTAPRLLLVQALRQQGEPAQAAAACEAARQAGVEFDETMCLEEAALRAESAEKLRDCVAALEKFPRSTALWREKAAALHNGGDATGAEAALRAAIEIDPEDGTLYKPLRNLLRDNHTPAEVAAEFDGLCARHPRSQALWRNVAETAGSEGIDKEYEVWKQAIDKTKMPVWAVEDAADFLLRTGNHKLALNLCASLLDKVQAKETRNDYSIGDVGKTFLLCARAAVQFSQHEPMDDALRSQALGVARETRRRMMPQAECLRLISYLELGSQDLSMRDKALAHALSAAFLDPDDDEHIFDLFARFGIGWPTGGPLLYRNVHRQPYESTKLRRGIQLHAMYGGSEVLALKWAAELKERVPDKSAGVEPMEAVARANLGGGREAYCALFGAHGTDVIGTSQRYVNWFLDFCNGAQSSYETVDTTSLLHDGSVTLHPDNGVTEIRRDHPVSGLPTFRQVGAVSVEADYDDSGAMIKEVRTSAGLAIHYDWDDGTLRRVWTNTGDDDHLFVGTRGEIERATDKDGADITPPDDLTGVFGPPTAAAARLKGYLGYLRHLDASNIPLANTQLDAARNAFRDAFVVYQQSGAEPDMQALAAAEQSLATLLGQHLHDDGKIAAETENLLVDLFLRGEQQPRCPAPLARCVADAILQWRDVMIRTRHQGLALEDWSLWNRMRQFLARAIVACPLDADLRTKRDEVEQNPFSKIEGADWLSRSYLDNDAFWRFFPLAEVTPGTTWSAADRRCVLVRRNGDLVVGLSVGMAVRRCGFWERFAFDKDAHRFVVAGEDAPPHPPASSDVLSLCEDDRGALWVGTADGLFRLPADYDGAPERWNVAAGLPSPRIENILAVGKRLLIGTPRGLASYDGEHLCGVDGSPSQSANHLRLADVGQAGEQALAAFSCGLYEWRDGTLRRLADVRCTDAMWLSDEKALIVLSDGELQRAQWDGQSLPDAFVYMTSQDTIKKGSNECFTLGSLPLEEGGPVLTVLTNAGLFVYRYGLFERCKSPPDNTSHALTRLTRCGERMALLCPEGVYSVEKEQLAVSQGPINALLCDPAHRRTFVARPKEIDVVREGEENRPPQFFAAVNADHLALDAADRLIANDGVDIVRIDPSTGEVTKLFSARPSKPTHNYEGEGQVGGLLAASDGSIWATSGPALFHWKEGSPPEEHSVYIDPKVFPASSEWLAGVFETVEKKVWIVSSDETHLQVGGMLLSGGITEWDGTAFKLLTTSQRSDAWFLRSYTPMGDGRAIVTTNTGFAEHRGNGLAEFDRQNDHSYLALRARHKFLGLGTQGVPLDRDTWLFGTADGVIGYRAGTWFYPDRLNRLLPDDGLCLYGSRYVHALAADRRGFLYVGTNRGLLVYNTGGGDPIGFLMANQVGAEVFATAELERLSRVSADLLSQIDPKSDQGKLMAKARELKAKIADLEHRLPNSPHLLTSSDWTKERLDAEQFDITQLQEVKKQSGPVLLQIQQEFPSLYEMLELKPLDAVSVSRQLNPDQIILQYLPTPGRLYIQITSRSGTPLREVAVSADEVYKHASAAAQALSNGRSTRRAQAGRTSAAAAPENPDADLAWLYNVLLRPVEDLLAEKRDIFIVPVGQLTYVPFGALVRTPGSKPEYAVEKYNFGYLPSMYLLSLILNSASAGMQDALVLGDPDGTLPSAQEEARNVFNLLHGTTPPKYGKDACRAYFMANAAKVKTVHLATHGCLNADAPADSYIKLADDNLRIGELVNYKLNAEMVVLSACETGVGSQKKQGMEYVTLAQAFAHAGIPTQVATLWEVADAPSCQLMTAFYTHLLQGDDHFTAMTNAQRDLLHTDHPVLNDPSAWASYVVFGKP